jgi:hypothetical protein
MHFESLCATQKGLNIIGDDLLGTTSLESPIPSGHVRNHLHSHEAYQHHHHHESRETSDFDSVSAT